MSVFTIAIIMRFSSSTILAILAVFATVRAAPTGNEAAKERPAISNKSVDIDTPDVDGVPDVDLEVPPKDGEDVVPDQDAFDIEDCLDDPDLEECPDIEDFDIDKCLEEFDRRHCLHELKEFVKH